MRVCNSLRNDSIWFHLPPGELSTTAPFRASSSEERDTGREEKAETDPWRRRGSPSSPHSLSFGERSTVGGGLLGSMKRPGCRNLDPSQRPFVEARGTSN